MCEYVKMCATSHTAAPGSAVREQPGSPDSSDYDSDVVITSPRGLSSAASFRASVGPDGLSSAVAVSPKPLPSPTSGATPTAAAVDKPTVVPGKATATDAAAPSPVAASTPVPPGTS